MDFIYFLYMTLHVLIAPLLYLLLLQYMAARFKFLDSTFFV